MWFGTADGLNRYDGQNIKIYKISDKKIVNSNFVRGNICEDSKGNIWFCNETGLYCYNPLDDKLLRKVVFKKLRWATGIFMDKNDKFFLLHPGLGIYEFDTNTYQIILTACRFKTPYYTYVSEYSATNSRNTIWIKAPYANEILVYNTQNRTVKYLKTIIKFKSIFYAGNGKLYMGNKTGNFTITDTSLHLIDKITYTSKTKSLLEIRILHIDNYNRLWISTIDNGLMCYNEITKTFTHYLHNNSQVKSLPVNIISPLYIDRANNLWIGTDGGGVSKLDLKPPKFNLFPLNEGDYPFLKDYFIKCFYEDDYVKIWFGTHSSGFNIYNPRTGDVKNYNIQPAKSKGLPGSVISGIFKSKRGSIWIATSMGICAFNKNSNTFTTIKITDGPKLNEHNNFVYKIIELDNGDMVAATFYGLMVIKKANGVFTGAFCKPKPESNIFMTDVVEMNDHSFWASSPLYGIIHYKRLGNDFVILEKQLPLIDLRSIHKDEKNGNVLWVCTGIGLIKYNTLTRGQTLYNEKNGMANSYVYGVLEDEQHNFWMSTNMGICFFNRKENTFQNFTANDGLQSNEFNTQSFYKGKSGNIYFGGIQGFNWFKPETIKTLRLQFQGWQ